MNKWIISLRDLKVAIIEEIQCLVQELKTIQSSLHPFKHLPIPPVPQLHPDETPEKRFQYDNETLLKFKNEQEAKAQLKKSVASSEGGGSLAGFGSRFLHTPSMKEMELVTRGTSLKTMKTASATSAATPKSFEIEQAEPTEMELEIMKRDEISNIYLQESLIKRVRE